MTTYTVKAGDSLSKIARDRLGNMALWKDIAMLNNIRNADLIYPGQVLKLPEVQVIVPQQKAELQTASLGGLVVGGFLLLLVAGTYFENEKKKKAKQNA